MLNQELVLLTFSSHWLRVSIQICITPHIEILEVKKNVKDEAPKRKVNTRGVLKVDGYSDFNPDMNVQITKRGQSVKDKKKSKNGGCCK